VAIVSLPIGIVAINETGTRQSVLPGLVVDETAGGSGVWNANGVATVSWTPPVVNGTWNADGAATVSWGGYSTYWSVTWQANGLAGATWTAAQRATWNADGAASAAWVAATTGRWNAAGAASVAWADSSASWNADGRGAAQWSFVLVRSGRLNADGAASVNWNARALGLSIWNANGAASVNWDAHVNVWNADGAASVGWTGHAIAAAQWDADGAAYVSWSAEQAGPFYFAWIQPGEVWGPQHLRIDEVVFAFNIKHEEGQCATLELIIKNPFAGFLALGRQQWCYFSLVGGPLFKGRLLSIPSDMTGETLTMHFTAMPLDMLVQQRALASSLMVLPYWDPVFVDQGQRLDPQSVLEGYSKIWHVDRTSLVVTTSDLIVGEDGVVTVTEDDAFYDSVKPTVDKAPLLSVYVDATVNWTQYDVGSIDIGYKQWSGSSAGGMAGSWPKAGTEIGSGWYVLHSAVNDPNPEVKTSTYQVAAKNPGVNKEPFDLVYDDFGLPHAAGVNTYDNGDWLTYNFSQSLPYLVGKVPDYTYGSAGQSGPPTLTGGGGISFTTAEHWESHYQNDDAFGQPTSYSYAKSGTTFFNWGLTTKLVIGYKAQRNRSENVRFTLAANMQPVFTDPAEAGAQGLAANFAQNSEYLQLNGSVGLEGPYGRFTGNFVGGHFYTMFDIFIVDQGGVTYAFQAQRDHTSLAAFDSETAAEAFVAGTFYDAGDIFFSGGLYWQVLISGTLNSAPGALPVVIDPYLQAPALVLTGNPHAGRRLYQAVPQFRGNWLAGEVLVAGDMVIAPSGTWYRVAIGHHTAATFYQFAVDPTGRLLYELMLNPPPIGDLRASSYFPTHRGIKSLQNLIHRARAKIVARSRVLKVEFGCHFEIVANSVTLRKNVQLYDRRLPGGVALGKVVAYGIKGDGDSGQILGDVTIACTAGYGNAIAPATGTPDYVAATYVGNDYQWFDGEFVVLGTGDVSYSTPSILQIDDGLRFPLDYNQAVVAETVNVLGPNTIPPP
jgi:hypothetical protein